MTKTINPIGPTAAPIAIIGEAPGEEEEKEGIPFVPHAPSGGLITSLIQAAGLRREEVYLDNVVNIRPEYNDIYPFFNTSGFTAAGEQHKRQLIARLKHIDASVIVAVGRTAMCALTDERRSISLMRGSPLINKELNKVVIPALHPSYIERTGQFMWRYLLAAEIRNAVEISRAGGVDALPQREILVNPTYAEVMGFFDELADVDEFAFDLETKIDGEIPCISFSVNPLRGMSIPLQRFKGKEKKNIWSAMTEILTSSEQRKITQNGNYDTFFLSWFHNINIPLDTLDDTMIAHHIMYPQMLSAMWETKSLALLCSLWAWEPFYKNDGTTAKAIGDFTLYQQYNCKDSLVTHHVKDRIWPILEADKDLLHTYRFTMERFPAIQTMQRNGFRVDRRGLGLEREQMKKDLEVLQEELDDLAGGLFATVVEPLLIEYDKLVNIRAEHKQAKSKDAAKALTPQITKLRTRLRQWCKKDAAGKAIEWEFTLDPESSDKCCAYFYDFCGEKPLMKHRKSRSGAKTTRSLDDEALRSLGKPTTKRKAYREAHIIQAIRERGKLVSNYIDIDYDFATGRYHASFNPRGTWTGRYSSSKLFFHIGSNQQNIPPRIRQYYLPDKPVMEH